MKFVRLGVCLVLAMLSVGAAASPSDHGLIPIQYDRRDNDHGQMPGGSWQATCRRGAMRGSTLSAECQDARGRWQPSALDMASCAGFSAANRDGGLICEGRRGGGMPGGSWQASCRRPDQRGSRFQAECQDSRGRWQPTFIDLSTCASNRIANRDGGLICE